MCSIIITPSLISLSLSLSPSVLLSLTHTELVLQEALSQGDFKHLFLLTTADESPYLLSRI